MIGLKTMTTIFDNSKSLINQVYFFLSRLYLFFLCIKTDSGFSIKIYQICQTMYLWIRRIKTEYNHPPNRNLNITIQPTCTTGSFTSTYQFYSWQRGKIRWIMRWQTPGIWLLVCMVDDLWSSVQGSLSDIRFRLQSCTRHRSHLIRKICSGKWFLANFWL